jgi:hypothetical protein
VGSNPTQDIISVCIYYVFVLSCVGSGYETPVPIQFIPPVPAKFIYFLIVGFEVLAAVVMKIAIFWDTVPCISYMNRRFGGTYHFHLQGRKSAEQETSDSRMIG